MYYIMREVTTTTNTATRILVGSKSMLFDIPSSSHGLEGSLGSIVAIVVGAGTVATVIITKII